MAGPEASLVSAEEQWFQGLARQVAPETLLRRNESLARRTTLRVGGPADFYVEPASENDLATVVRAAGQAGVPLFVLGRGSNLLVRDRGFRGVVVCLARPCFGRIALCGSRLDCGAGARLKAVAAAAKRAGISGLEFLEGIPGTVGGALRMNAGAMGSETFERVVSVRSLDREGRIHERPAREIAVGYRNCPFFRIQIALGAVFEGDPADPATVGERMQRYSRQRWASQPAASSAGCMFKNPSSIPAGKLVEELGLKGRRIGGAMVSPEHGNFIVNTGGATADDFLALLDLVRETARRERGVELETEVEILGE